MCTVYKDMSAMFTFILNCYMNATYVKDTKLQDMDPKAVLYFLPINDIYLGVKVPQHLNYIKDKVSKQNMYDFFNRYQSFLIELCIQLKSRLPIEPMYEYLEFLDPQMAVFGNFKSLPPLLLKFPNLITESLKVRFARCGCHVNRSTSDA